MIDLVDQARAEIDGVELRGLARALVRARSENPAGSTAEACSIVADTLAAGGFAVERFEPEPGHVSVVASYDFPEAGRTLLLNGHVDVVPAAADGWSRDPWAAEIDGDRLYGRGSLDMKGPVAALVLAARGVVDARLPLRGRLVVAAVADEEAGGRYGMGALVTAGTVDADAAVIAEPGDGGVVIAHRGMCFVQLTTRGRSVHASIAHKGVNAVESMVEALRACRTLELRHTPHPLLGAPSIVMGTTIEGGQTVNVVPDLCRATLDVRSVPGMRDEEVREDLRRHFDATLPAQQRPEVEILMWGEAGATDPNAEIVVLAAEAYAHEFGRQPELRAMPAATDGWWLTNRAGIPTVMGLAPGAIEQCHVVDESIDLGELERYARIYAHVVAAYLRPDRADGGAGVREAD
jgi:acetylornithine deacetylase/succinyl-diaminopimelate desuccinylase family protein